MQNTILDIKNPYVITTKGRCFRYESNNLNSNTRLWDFTMREIVFIGTEEAVETLRQQSMQFVRDLVEILKLNCFIETASDPFFIDIKNKEYFQLITKVKYELRMNIPFNNTSIAVASFNSHGNHFGRSYHITSKTGTYVNTGCTAFGIERWVYAFLSQYGLDMSLWPKKMKQLIEKKDNGMDTSVISLRIIEIIEEVLLQKIKIDINTDLAYYGIDSLILIQVIVIIEREFGIRFDNADLTTFKNVYNLSQYISEKLSITQSEKI